MSSSSKYKRWQHARYLKEMRYRARIKRGKIKKNRSDNVPHHPGKRSRSVIFLRAPMHFSLVNNKEETLEYFNHALSAIENCTPRQEVFFDLKAVSLITPDAIMYLIALVNNCKRCRTTQTICRGNLPDNPNARSYIEKSGFYSFVSTQRMLPPPNMISAIQISSGCEVDPEFIGNICSFVSSKSALPERLHTKGLYQIITELMTNTIQHAYTDSTGIMDNRWYIYVEDMEDRIQFVFLDTGVGIPNKIKKNFWEKVAQFVGNSANDAKLISSALKGVYRSETGEKHRGKGLPNIYEASKTDRISCLNILSGFGQCTVDDTCFIVESNLSISFSGTLFCWQFDKNVED